MTEYHRIKGSPDQIDALIVAAKMNGCWEQIDSRANVYLIKSHPFRVIYMSTLMRRHAGHHWVWLCKVAKTMGLMLS